MVAGVVHTAGPVCSLLAPTPAPSAGLRGPAHRATHKRAAGPACFARSRVPVAGVPGTTVTHRWCRPELPLPVPIGRCHALHAPRHARPSGLGLRTAGYRFDALAYVERELGWGHARATLHAIRRATVALAARHAAVPVSQRQPVALERVNADVGAH